jgi:hypothetical protein
MYLVMSDRLDKFELKVRSVRNYTNSKIVSGAMHCTEWLVKRLRARVENEPLQSIKALSESIEANIIDELKLRKLYKTEPSAKYEIPEEVEMSDEYEPGSPNQTQYFEADEFEQEEMMMQQE